MLLQRLFYFSAAILVSIVLGSVGYYLIFLHINTIDSTTYLIAGLILILGAVFIVPASYVKFRLQFAASAVTIGAYFLARAAGIFHELWLAKLIGVASWIAVVILLYVFWPFRNIEEELK